MRIISGENKGKKLHAPEGMSVRPTSDKIKEAIFNIIGPLKEDAKVLDLFAGSGNVGIEFIARGAKTCYFSDVSHKSLSYVKKNLELCNFLDRSKIIKSDYEKTIVSLSNLNEKFDYIFADPPYDLYCCENIIEKIIEYKILKTGGLLIIERDKTEDVKKYTDSLYINIKEKNYGRTNISIIELLEEI